MNIHPSFCRRIVVISYRITIAKIGKNQQLANFSANFCENVW